MAGFRRGAPAGVILTMKQAAESFYGPSAFPRSRSGSLAMLAAIRRVSSRVSSLAAAPASGLVLEIECPSACPVASRTMKQSWPSFISGSSTNQGGGKPRGIASA
jgi:hypothetical protein